jgi:hypothetical protein
MIMQIAVWGGIGKLNQNFTLFRQVVWVVLLLDIAVLSDEQNRVH